MCGAGPRRRWWRRAPTSRRTPNCGPAPRGGRFWTHNLRPRFWLRSASRAESRADDAAPTGPRPGHRRAAPPTPAAPARVRRSHNRLDPVSVSCPVVAQRERAQRRRPGGEQHIPQDERVWVEPGAADVARRHVPVVANPHDDQPAPHQHGRPRPEHGVTRAAPRALQRLVVMASVVKLPPVTARSAKSSAASPSRRIGCTRTGNVFLEIVGVYWSTWQSGAF